MGGCQYYGPLLGPYYNTAPNIQGTQKGTLILTTIHMLTVAWASSRDVEAQFSGGVRILVSC